MPIPWKRSPFRISLTCGIKTLMLSPHFFKLRTYLFEMKSYRNKGEINMERKNSTCWFSLLMVTEPESKRLVHHLGQEHGLRDPSTWAIHSYLLRHICTEMNPKYKTRIWIIRGADISAGGLTYYATALALFLVPSLGNSSLDQLSSSNVSHICT